MLSPGEDVWQKHGQTAHPGVAVQCASMERALQCVTKDNVRELLRPLDMDLEAMAFMRDHNPDAPDRLFNVNANYSVTARCKHGECIELLLQISNTHEWFCKSRAHTKVAAMVTLNRADVPHVPRVYSFSTEAGRGALGCAYVLMERMPGRQLSEVWDGLGEEERERVRVQMWDWHEALRTVAVEHEQFLFASLRMSDDACDTAEALEGCSIVADGPSVGDGYALGPCHSVLDWISANLNLVLDLCTASSHTPADKELLELLEMAVKEFEAERESLAMELDEKACCGLTHNDIHLGNVLVEGSGDSIRLSGVVDWESAMYSVRDRDVKDMCDAFGGTVGRHSRLLQWIELVTEAGYLFFYLATWFGGTQNMAVKEQCAVAEHDSACRGVTSQLRTMFE